jgi:predicted peptidase
MIAPFSCAHAQPSGASTPPRETGFLNRAIDVAGVSYRYQVFVPASWTPEKKWPVVLFLHGAGERGDDGLIQTEVGIGGAIRRHADRYPYVVVMPQCRTDDWWTTPAEEAQALAALDAAISEWHGDSSRVVLTGLSMGGYGTYGFALHHPGRFTALVPICGGILAPPAVPVPPVVPNSPGSDPYGEVAQKIGKTPIWLFHGADDTVVPVDFSRKMANALHAAGASSKYTEYPGVGHNSWDKAYAEPELAKWVAEAVR